MGRGQGPVPVHPPRGKARPVETVTRPRSARERSRLWMRRALDDAADLHGAHLARREWVTPEVIDQRRPDDALRLLLACWFRACWPSKHRSHIAGETPRIPTFLDEQEALVGSTE